MSVEPKKVKPNLRLIADLTGFSIATISNALNHKKGVNPQTATAIFRVAKELGYLNEDTISKIKLVIFRKNGLVVDDAAFFSRVFDGVEKECRALGYEFVLSHLTQQEQDYAQQVSWLLYDSSSALILLGSELSDADMVPFRNASCPILTLDFCCSDMLFNGVLVNNGDSAKMAVSFLISKGHTEIGYLKSQFRIKAYNSRAQGYRFAMHTAGIPLEPEYTVTLRTTFDGAYEDMLSHIDSGSKLPTAFFADNDTLALGAMKALAERGIRIPDDVSIIGFDDLPYSDMSTPPLTTLRVPKREMGQLAVQRIDEMIRNGSKIKLKIQVSTSFIERESVADKHMKVVDGHEKKS